MASTAVIYDLIARDAASKTFDKVGRAADGMGSKMAKVGKVAVALGAGLVALGAGAAEAADKAAEFQSSMTKISTQAGGTTKDVKALSKQVLDLSKSTEQGPQALSEALYHLKSVGMDNVSAMKSLKVASDLAAVGGSNLEDTTNALAGAWRTGIKGAGTFSQAAKTVNAIIGAGNMSMQDFTDALASGILPTAKTFGLSLTQVGSALALFTDEGVPASDAATRLRMSISLLGAPSAASEKQLKKIGLTGLDLATAMRGPNGIIGAIQLLKDHLDASGLSAAQQSQILSRAFGGGRSSSGILSLVNNLDVLKQKQDQVNASTGKYAQAVKTQRQTAQAQWAILTSNLQEMTISLGLKLLPPITKFVQYINKTAIPEAGRFGKALTSLVPVDKIRSALGKVQASVSGFFTGLAKNTGISGLWNKLTKPPKPVDAAKILGSTANNPYGSVAPSIRYTGGPAASPYGTVAAHPTSRTRAPYGDVAAQYGGTVSPYGNVAAKISPKGAAAPAPSGIKLAGQRIAQMLNAGIGDIDWGKVGSVLGKGIGNAFDWVAGHTADLSKKFANILGKIDWVNVGKSLGALAIPLSIGIIDNLFAPLFTADFWKKHWLDLLLAAVSVVPIGKVADVAGNLLGKIPWGKVGQVLGKVPWGKIFSFGDKIPWGKIFTIDGKIPWDKVLTLGDFGPAAVRWVRGVFDGLQSGFTSRFPKVAQWFSDQLTLLPTRFGDLGRLLTRKGKELVDGLGKAIVDNIPGMNNKFIRGIAKFWGRFTFWETGVNLVEGLYNGAVSKLSDGYNWVKKNWVDPLVNDVKSLFGVHSPSTVFAGIGGNLVDGLRSGILAGVKGLATWVWSHMGAPVVNRFSAAGTWLVSKGAATVSGLKSGIVSGAKALGGWVTSHVVTPVTSRFAAAGSWLLSRGSQVVSGLKSGVSSGAKAIGSWAYTHVAQPLTSRFSAANSWLMSRGSQLISGLRSGIASGMKGIATWVKSHVVDPVVNAVKKYFGIHSPSTVMAGLGGHLVAGLVKGLATTDGASIVSQVFGSMPKALGALVKKGLVHIEQLPGKALSALGGLGGDLLSFLGLGGGSGTSGSNQALGKSMMLASGWSSAQWPALKALWTRESGWNARAKNPSSGAYGIPQSLPATKMASAGKDWMTNPATQIKWGLGYIMSRYGSPAAAWAHETKVGWYAKGGLAPIGQTAWVGERGPELMQVTPKGTRIISNGESMAMAGALGIRLPGYASGTVASAQSRVADAQDNLARAKRRRLGVQAAETRLAAAKQELANAKKSTASSVANTLSNGFLKTLETGTASAITSAVKSINTKLQAAGAGSMVSGNNKTASKLASLANQKASIASQISAANQAAADQSSSLGDFLSVTGTTATSVHALAIQMEEQQDTARKFASEAAALSKKGLDKGLLQQLASQGPGGTLAALLNGANASDITQLNKLAKSQSSLTTSFGKTMADAMYDSGSQAGKGFLTGLQAQEKAIQAEMDKLGAGLVKSIKKRLKIKSPSRVMRDEVGRQVGAGLVAGMDAHRTAVAAAASRMAAAATAATWTRGQYRAAPVIVQTAPQQPAPVHVHVHVDDPKFKEMFRVEVEHGFEDFATALAAGRNEQ